MTQWDGTTERRNDDIPTRVVLLEHCHTENKISLAAVHKRITKMEDTIVAKLDVSAGNCTAHRTETTKLQNDVKWLKGWVGSAWAAIAAGIGLIIHGKK